MLDFLKRKLEIGDSVVLIHPSYKQLLLARVIRFTAKGDDCYVKWGESKYSEKRQRGDQLVKVDGPDLTMYLLKK
jgi:hypothetical protein